MPDCNLCPGLFELAHRKPNTWVRISLWHGTDGRHDACQVQIIRDKEEAVTGSGETWQEAMADLMRQVVRETDAGRPDDTKGITCPRASQTKTRTSKP